MSFSRKFFEHILCIGNHWGSIVWAVIALVYCGYSQYINFYTFSIGSSFIFVV